MSTEIKDHQKVLGYGNNLDTTYTLSQKPILYLHDYYFVKKGSDNDLKLKQCKCCPLDGAAVFQKLGMMSW